MEEPVIQFDSVRASPLPEGTSLRQRYSVRNLLHADSCVLTYAGFDYVARQPVAILEFFPAAIAMRELGVMTVSPSSKENGELFFVGMEAFYRQHGKLLQTIGSPNVLSIFDVFFENGTAYAIAERPEGMTLAEYCNMQGRRISEGELVYIARALADAFLVVHSCNTLHHGISENTILLCTDGTVKLTGFGAGPMTVERGCAQRDDEPRKDIRALGETLYFAYTGEAPRNADAPAVERLPLPLQALFTGMLSTEPSLRFDSVFDMRYTTDNLPIAQMRPAVTRESIASYRARPRKRMAAGAKTRAPYGDAAVANAKPDDAHEKAPDKPVAIAIAVGAVLLALIGILLFALLRR